MPPAAHSGSSTARAEAFRKSRPRSGTVAAERDGGAAAEPLEVHEQVGGLREREQLLHGVEGDAAQRAGSGPRGR